MLYNLVDVPGCPCPPSLLNNSAVQKLLQNHSVTLDQEIKLGFDFATMIDITLVYGMLNDPSTNAVAAAVDFSNHYWTQSDISKSYNVAQGLSAEILAAQVGSEWNASYGTLWDWFDMLELIHLKKVAILSGLDLNTLMWGDTSFNTAYAAMVSYKSFANAFGPVSVEVAKEAALGFVPINALDASGNVLSV